LVLLVLFAGRIMPGVYCYCCQPSRCTAYPGNHAPIGGLATSRSLLFPPWCPLAPNAT